MFVRLLVAVALIAPLVPAQISAKEARDAIKDGIEAANDVYRDAVKQATEEGVEVIKAFTKQVKSQGFVPFDLFALFSQLEGVQAALRDAYDAAEVAMAVAGQEALAAYLEGLAEQDGGSPIVPGLPPVFVEKERGVLAKARLDLARRAEKAASKMRGALKKTAKVMESEVGLALSYVVEPVEPLYVRTFGPQATVSEAISSAAPITIDLVLVTRALDDAEAVSGDMWMGGTASEDSIKLVRRSTYVITSVVGIIPDASSRWSYSLAAVAANTILTVTYADDEFSRAKVDMVVVGSR